jgi:peptide/nickel transport system substrate-binding protein
MATTTEYACARVYGFSIFDPLIMLTPDGEVGPGIAESWDISPDGMTWTLHIRQGVKFHDGSLLTGEDVKFSIERIMAPESVLGAAIYFNDRIDTMELTDDYTLVLHLKMPCGETWEGLNAGSGPCWIVPKKYFEENGVEYFDQYPIGSGPWKLVNYVRDSVMELEAVEEHWRAVPHFQKLKLMVVPEEATRIAMLKTGEADLAAISISNVADTEKAGVRVLRYPAGQMVIMSFYYDLENPQEYPVSDIRVREALSLAINREELGNVLFSGFAEPLAMAGVPPWLYFFDANSLKPDSYDPAEAKRLLDEAGYSNGFSIKIYSAGLDPWVDTLNQAIGGYWEEIGLQVTVEPVEFMTLVSLMIPQPQPDIWGNAAQWYMSGMTGVKLSPAYHSILGWHKNHLNAELDALIEKAEATIDLDERGKLGLEAAVKAKNEYATLSLLMVDQAWGVSDKVGDWTPIKGAPVLSLVYETITPAK